MAVMEIIMPTGDPYPYDEYNLRLRINTMCPHCLSDSSMLEIGTRLIPHSKNRRPDWLCLTCGRTTVHPLDRGEDESNQKSNQKH